jgi:NAD(P)-dependent dehydrogenase (short-subunit alcohol dehydrogenase family)
MSSGQHATTGLSRRAMLGAAAAGTVGFGASSLNAAARTAAPEVRQRFAGKVVIITGATSGIGAAAARAFAAEGAQVAFCGRREALGHQVEAEIRAAGGEATYIRADVRVPEDVAAFVEQAVARYGGLHVAFNNAGIQKPFTPLHEQSVADWDDTFLTNVRGVYLAMKAEIPHMLAGGGGSIVVTSSSATMVARPGLAAYAATKEALQGIVRAAALEYGEQGIRINALLPGITDTPMVRPPDLDDATWAQAKPLLGQLNVDGLHRLAEPEEIAAAALMLASDDLPYVTGVSFSVDGGLSAGRPLAIPELPREETPA